MSTRLPGTSILASCSLPSGPRTTSFCDAERDVLDDESAARVRDGEAAALGQRHPGPGDGLAALVAHRPAEAVRLLARPSSEPARWVRSVCVRTSGPRSITCRARTRA